MWYLICFGIVAIAVGMACWIANATPMEEWRELHELEFDAQAQRKDAATAQKCNSVCITVQSLQRPEVQEAESEAVTDSRTSAGKPP